MNRDGDARPLMLGVAGFGTVGSGLASILADNQQLIRLRTGREIRIKSILVRNPAKQRTIPFPQGAKVCSDMRELVDDPEIDVIVELMGGLKHLKS